MLGSHGQGLAVLSHPGVHGSRFTVGFGFLLIGSVLRRSGPVGRWPQSVLPFVPLVVVLVGKVFFVGQPGQGREGSHRQECHVHVVGMSSLSSCCRLGRRRCMCLYVATSSITTRPTITSTQAVPKRK